MIRNNELVKALEKRTEIFCMDDEDGSMMLSMELTLDYSNDIPDHILDIVQFSVADMICTINRELGIIEAASE